MLSQPRPDPAAAAGGKQRTKGFLLSTAITCPFLPCLPGLFASVWAHLMLLCELNPVTWKQFAEQCAPRTWLLCFRCLGGGLGDEPPVPSLCNSSAQRSCPGSSGLSPHHPSQALGAGNTGNIIWAGLNPVQDQAKGLQESGCFKDFQLNRFPLSMGKSWENSPPSASIDPCSQLRYHGVAVSGGTPPCPISLGLSSPVSARHPPWSSRAVDDAFMRHVRFSLGIDLCWCE